MKLEEQYVLSKTKAASLADVRNLNLWGNGITDVSVRVSHSCVPMRAALRAWLADNHLFFPPGRYAHAQRRSPVTLSQQARCRLLYAKR